VNEANLSIYSLLKIIKELRKENAELRKENAEFRKIILELNAIITEQSNKIKELEERLKKHSQNSNQPPSTDQYAKKSRPKSEREKSGKKAGSQPGHKGATLHQIQSPDEIIYCHVDQCEACCCNLSSVESKKYIARQECDIPQIKPKITEYRMTVKICPKCKLTNKAKCPKKLTQPIQYGERIVSLAAYLHYSQLIPLKRVQCMFSDLFSLSISEGTLVNRSDQLHKQLSFSESKVHENLIASPVNNCDETSMRVNDKTRWLHVVSNNANTVYFCHNKRGTDAMNAIGILPQYKGTIVHDNWKPYFTYKNMTHSLCNAHHIRELRGINENYNQSWAKEMRRHLLNVNTVIKEHKNAGKDDLPKEVIIKFSEQYDAILKLAISEIPTLKTTSTKSKKRGRIKQHPAKNLHDRLTKQKEETLRFMYDFKIPFTNNQAEQDVRMTKVKLKVSGCFRSQEGADRFCRIRGYISTSRKREINIIQSLENAIRGQPELF
jgi:transposase